MPKYKVRDVNDKDYVIEADSFYNQGGSLELYNVTRTESGYKDRTFVAVFAPSYWLSCQVLQDVG